MKGGIGIVVAMVAILAVPAAVQRGEAVVKCGQVDSQSMPCVNFLTGHEANPPKPCCDRVKAVKAMAVTPDDKRTACGCVKAAANRYTGLVNSAARASPEYVVSRSASLSPATSTATALVENDWKEKRPRRIIGRVLY